MSNYFYKTATPPAGSLTRIVSRLLSAWRARRSEHALEGMGERELQDIGWGQADRYSHSNVHSTWRN